MAAQVLPVRLAHANADRADRIDCLGCASHPDCTNRTDCVKRTDCAERADRTDCTDRTDRTDHATAIAAAPAAHCD